MSVVPVVGEERPTTASGLIRVTPASQNVGGDKRNKRLLQMLEELDRDGSGTIDVAELLSLLEGVMNSRRERKYMCVAIIGMFVFGLILIGTIIGLTYAMLYSLKDTEVKGGIMYVKNSDGVVQDIIRTGSAEFGVGENGLFMHRLANSSSAAQTASDSGTVLKTASFMGTPQAFNSEVDIQSLMELKYLLINGTGKAQLGLVVLGVARVPLEGSVHGTVLHIVTVAGTITLDATVVTFSTAIANIFAEAGFRISTTRRVLLGSYAVLGFFNTVKDLSASGKPAGMPGPRLPAENFVMKLKIYEPCAIPERPNVDRILPESDTVDLAGVELYKGARYMTHTETTYSYGASIRVMYEFPIYPGWQRIEVLTANSKEIQSWQATAPPEGSTNPIETYFCRNFTIPSSGPAGFNSSSVLNYTYVGVDSVGADVLARHFEMYVTQASSTKPGQTEVLRIDYWDRLDNNTPLRFEFRTADVGVVAIDVVEVRNITSASPEAAPAMFAAPAVDSCPSNPRLPRLSSAFMTRGEIIPVDLTAGADAAAGRRLLEYTDSLAPLWEQLDHVNGTGDWPQWALDMYGGVHPARRSQAAVRRALAECGTKVSIGIPIGVCDIEYTAYQNGAFAIAAGCGGNVGPVAMTGSLELDSCESKIKGCLTISVGLPENNWLVKKLGVELDIDFAQACVGYNYKERFFFIEAALILNVIVAKAELSLEIDFSSCCIWIASVTLEASVGVSFLNIWVTLGSIDIVSDVYLRGSPEKQDEDTNPTAINLVGGWLTVSDGYWGDWKKVSYPCGKFTYNSVTAAMELVALPINSYQVRMEPQQGSGDDTALNGIQ
ncbi:hypothetical protein GPECTOR_85g355 [Gonium pectorale]|uniref:EF-hand domain-containing protein n=1 Tax=Gonium pectorale TaxID=33097 RepID=A0A150G295_GONPE|nr:hypothetical protein GPECTOR_85g355 [Gonium pectorale]|eukprot:KXZ43625.1 hypothetical protein GPECTOR_85g355 [Gonium pectorale]